MPSLDHPISIHLKSTTVGITGINIDHPLIVGTSTSPEDVLASKNISSILRIYSALSQIPHLNPGEEVNRLFGELVGICGQILEDGVVAKIITDPRIVKITAHLRELCSDGEGRMEAYWAEKVCAAGTTIEEANAELQNFTYFQNYQELTRMELHAITSIDAAPTPRSFAFIGSGPLPLTSLCIADTLADDSTLPLVIHNIDRDQRAITLSTELAKRLGSRAESLTFKCEEADGEGSDLRGFDVVYLAALVGSTGERKREIIRDVVRRMKIGALLVLRSAHSLRSLLYPVVNASSDLKSAGLEPFLVVHPYNHIINSVVIARVTHQCML